MLAVGVPTAKAEEIRVPSFREAAHQTERMLRKTISESLMAGCGRRSMNDDGALVFDCEYSVKTKPKKGQEFAGHIKPCSATFDPAAPKGNRWTLSFDS